MHQAIAMSSDFVIIAKHNPRSARKGVQSQNSIANRESEPTSKEKPLAIAKGRVDNRNRNRISVHSGRRVCYEVPRRPKPVVWRVRPPSSVPYLKSREFIFFAAEGRAPGITHPGVLPKVQSPPKQEDVPFWLKV